MVGICCIECPLKISISIKKSQSKESDEKNKQHPPPTFDVHDVIALRVPAIVEIHSPHHLLRLRLRIATRAPDKLSQSRSHEVHLHKAMRKRGENRKSIAVAHEEIRGNARLTPLSIIAMSPEPMCCIVTIRGVTEATGEVQRVQGAELKVIR